MADDRSIRRRVPSSKFQVPSRKDHPLRKGLMIFPCSFFHNLELGTWNLELISFLFPLLISKLETRSSKLKRQSPPAFRPSRLPAFPRSGGPDVVPLFAFPRSGIPAFPPSSVPAFRPSCFLAFQPSGVPTFPLSGLPAFRPSSFSAFRPSRLPAFPRLGGWDAVPLFAFPRSGVPAFPPSCGWKVGYVA